MLLGVGVERYHDVTIERLHECDPGQHGAAVAAAQHQRFDCYLPRRQVGLLFRQLCNLIGCVLQLEQLPAVGQSDGIFKRVDQGTRNALLPCVRVRRDLVYWNSE